MKTYFEKLQSIGLSAIQELRAMDKRHAGMNAGYYEDKRNGILTEHGYLQLSGALDQEREKKTSGIKNQISQLREEFDREIGRRFDLSSYSLDSGDVAMMQTVTLSPDEFNAMTEKHKNNPAMCKFLNEYKESHEGQILERDPLYPGHNKVWHSDWRYQDAEECRSIFRNACGCVVSIMGQMDKYIPNREGTLQKDVSECYHQLAGSDPEALPAPAPVSEATPAKNYTVF